MIHVIKTLEQHTDPELILSWYEGNEYAFKVIYERHFITLLAIAVQKTADRDVARELVQDTFINLYQSRHSAQGINSIRAYLYVILKNKILNHHRSELVRRKYYSSISSESIQSDNSTLAGIETRELEKQLNAEIEKLPPQCRTVFKLSRKDYMSNKEIAFKLGITENTVEQHMRKALRNLRSSLKIFTQYIVLICMVVLNFK